MSDQLSALEATFLELEQLESSAPMHIGGVMIFDAAPRGGRPQRDRIRDEFVAQLPDLPRWSRRLSAPHTGGLRWPTWVTDPTFDIRDHVFEVQLPSPPGENELLSWALQAAGLGE